MKPDKLIYYHNTTPMPIIDTGIVTQIAQANNVEISVHQFKPQASYLQIYTGITEITIEKADGNLEDVRKLLEQRLNL